MSINPFLQLHAIKDRNYFYGREALLHEIAEHILAGQFCSIVGEHKTGKSSILYFLAHEHKFDEILIDPEIYKLIFFDFQSEVDVSQSLLWGSLLKEISEKINDIDLLDEINGLANSSEIRFSMLKTLFRKITRKGYKLVFLFDEFDYVAFNPQKFDPDFLLSLRSLVNFNIVLIVSTRKGLSDLFPSAPNSTSPFNNIFRELYVGILSEEETSNLILQTKKPIKPNLNMEKDFIIRNAGTHPYIVQQFCFQIYKIKKNKEHLLPEDYKFVQEKCYEELLPFFHSIWIELTDQQKEILINFVRNGSVSNFSDIGQIRQLNKLGLIVQNTREYELFSPIFKNFIELEILSKLPVIPVLNNSQRSENSQSSDINFLGSETIYNPTNFIPEQSTARITQFVRRLFTKLIDSNIRQNFLSNSGIDNNFIARLNTTLNPLEFSIQLVSEFKNFEISDSNQPYHPFYNFLSYIIDTGPDVYGIPTSNVLEIYALSNLCQENFKALKVRNAIGRIEAPLGKGIGTGILINKNTVLTCYHLFSKNNVSNAWIRFGYYGGTNDRETLYELNCSFLAADSILDYALLVTTSNPGRYPLKPYNSTLSSGEESRIRIVHHPDGGCLEISNLNPIIQSGIDYIDYRLPTTEGSSGGAICDNNWNLVAIHRGYPGIGRYVQTGTVTGLPISAFWNKLKSI